MQLLEEQLHQGGKAAPLPCLRLYGFASSG
jgi:hypothetical protein